MRKTIVILLAALISPSAYSAVTVNVKPDQGTSKFLAVGNPGFLKINGEGEGPEGQLTIENKKLSGTLAVNLDSLDTGMGLRNRHMKEKYLNTAENPKALLKFDGVELPHSYPVDAEIKNQTVKATLTVNKTEKPVTVTYSIDKSSRLKASFKIKITDFNIEIPSFMNVTVADSVDVNVETKLVTDGSKQ